MDVGFVEHFARSTADVTDDTESRVTQYGIRTEGRPATLSKYEEERTTELQQRNGGTVERWSNNTQVEVPWEKKQFLTLAICQIV